MSAVCTAALADHAAQTCSCTAYVSVAQFDIPPLKIESWGGWEEWTDETEAVVKMVKCAFVGDKHLLCHLLEVKKSRQ